MIVRIHVCVRSPSGAASMSATTSSSETFPMIFLVSMRVCELKGLDLGEESFHLGLHCGVDLIGGCKCGCVLGGVGCEFFFVDLEAQHHLICNGVGVMEAQFVNRSAGFPEFKVSFLEVALEFIPCFVLRIGASPRPDVVFEDSLYVEDNKGEVYCLTLG